MNDVLDVPRLCPHPLQAIRWNPYLRKTVCHRCGAVMDDTELPSEDAMHCSPWTCSLCWTSFATYEELAQHEADEKQMRWEVGRC